MWYRHAVLTAMLPAVAVLPVWLLVARGIVAGDSSWNVLGYLLLAPFLALALALVAGVVWWRGSVRRARAVSPLDAVLLSAWWASLIAYGIVPEGVIATAVGVLAVVLGLACFWAGIVQLVRDARRRVREVLAAFELQAQPPAPGYDARRDRGPVIRIDPR